MAVCLGCAAQDTVMTLLNLLNGVRVVVGRDWDVTAVKDSRPAVERVGLEGNVVAAYTQ